MFFVLLLESKNQNEFSPEIISILNVKKCAYCSRHMTENKQHQLVEMFCLLCYEPNDELIPVNEKSGIQLKIATLLHKYFRIYFEVIIHWLSTDSIIFYFLRIATNFSYNLMFFNTFVLLITV